MTERGRRVAQVATTYGVTSETFIPDAVASVDGAGWESWLVTIERHQPDAFPYPPPERTLTPADAPLTRRARPSLRRGWPSPDRLAGDLWRPLREAGVSVVHAHFGWSALYALPLARRLGLPLVTTFHASDVTVWPGTRGGPAVYDELFAEMTRALAVAEFTAQALRDIGWDGPTDIVPAGVRVDRFPFRAQVPDPAPPRIVFVGRLVPRKGVDVLLRALPDVVAALGPVGLDVVGDGPERAALEALAAELGIAGRVRFLGARAPEEVSEALGAGHVFAMPSRAMPDGEVEGSPVVLKEALAVGVPVVATDTGGTAEVMPPPYRHELVPSDDAPALAERLIAVLGDPGSWSERARTGRAWAEEQFDWTRLGERTASIYAAVCR